MTQQLVHDSELEALADAGDELDDAFDSISGVWNLSQLQPPGRGLRRVEEQAVSVQFAVGTQDRSEEVAGDAVWLDPEDLSDGWVTGAPSGSHAGWDDPLDFTLDDSCNGEPRALEWSQCRPLDDQRSWKSQLDDGLDVALVHAAYLGRQGHPHGPALVACETLLAQSLGEANHSDALESSLDDAFRELRHSLASADATIPCDWLRGPFLGVPLEDAALASMLRFSVKQVSSSPGWYERFGTIALRSASRRAADGRLCLRPIEEMNLVWDGVLPQVSTTDAQIASSLRIFEGATEALKDLIPHPDFLESEFFREVVGHWIALREHVFCHEILYAVCGLQVELANWMESLPNGMVAPGELDRLITTSFEDAGEILGVALEGGRQEDFFDQYIRACRASDRPKLPSSSQGRRQVAPAVAPGRFWLAVKVAIVAASLLLALPMLFEEANIRSRDLQAMSAADAQRLHPIVVSAKAGDRETSLIVARTSPETWGELSSDGRRTVANELAVTAADRGTRSVLVYESDRLVVEITAGEVVYVE